MEDNKNEKLKKRFFSPNVGKQTFNDELDDVDEIGFKSSVISKELKINGIPPIKFIKKFAYISQAGQKKNHETKVNQDSFLVFTNGCKLKEFNIFGVLDGHGANGHLVSRFVAKNLANFFKKNKKLNRLTSEMDVYQRLIKNKYRILRKAFYDAEKDLSTSDIDANVSGTTCALALQIGEKIICANVGDSRTIIVKGNKVTALSVDQKPNNPEELKRINRNGGVVTEYFNGEDTGVYRIFAKGENYPGLAVSRTIGDLIATPLGVIPEPVFTENNIDKDTNFIIIATDGIWEFLNNIKVAEIVSPYYKNNDPDGACKALIKKATDYWIKEDIVVDDITVIAIFF